MKTKQTKIPVEIASDYAHESGNELEQARQQIELSSFYLQTLFNSVKHLASRLESRVDEKERENCVDLHNLADIGYAVSNTIFAALSKIEPDAHETPEAEQPKTESLAERISYLINSDDVPEFISDGISEVMSEFFNEEVNQTEFVAETHSAAYIERLLQNHRPEDSD